LDIPQTERIDIAAVEALYQQHAAGIHAFLRGVLKDADLAAEVLQSTFARAIERAHTARPENIRGWLYRVALNEALAVRRRQKTHDRSLRCLGGGAVREQETPEDSACRQETAATVRRALERLPAEQRQVVRMRIYDEMTFAAIAEDLKLPLGTILTRMRLALKKLALHLPTEAKNPKDQ
jgi:RNA polymerase sigma-70 factor (ECF subfamily)